MEMMELMEWSERFRLGHSRIDRDHKKLISLINRLSSAMSNRSGQQVCGEVLDELVTYFQTHFALEEQLMSAHHYPHSVDHKAEHAKFVREVLELKARFDAGSVTLSISLLNFLRGWLANHILATDKALVAGLPPD